MRYKLVNLETLNSGAVLELFQAEWEKLLENIADPNVKPDAMREIIIKVKVKPTKDRSSANTSVEVKSKLASIMPHESVIVFSNEDGEKVQAYTSDPKQMEFGLVDDSIVPIKEVNK